MKNRMLFYLSLPIFVLGGMLFANPVCGAMTRGEPDSAAGSDQEGAPAFATFSDADSSIYGFFSAMAAQHMEKLWLHLDKPYYIAGDTVWFRAYLSDAVRHMPDTLSNFIYVDLYDRRNKLIAAKKIKRDSIGFANNLSLSDTLAAGEYTLQAYTGWMLNFSPDGFFQKNITIGQTVPNRIHSAVSYMPGQAIVRFCDANETPFADAEATFTLFDKTGKRISEARQQTTTTGAVFVDLPSDSIRAGGYIQTQLVKEGIEYKQTVFLEDDSDTFAIQFFPEGGDFIVGVPRLVAFKAECSDGYPAEVEGIILNGKGDTLTRFRSEHDGMGLFLLAPLAGESYRAVCKSNTKKLSTTLPLAKEATCALSVVQSAGYIHYQVDGEVPQGGRLIAHSRGVCCCIITLNVQKNTGAIITDSLPEGILHMLLVDSLGTSRSERLVFVSRPQEREQWRVTPDKPVYGKREKVHIDLTLKKNGQPLCGDFSVSITDRKTVQYDPLEENIRTNLLLTSDLKGSIHNPGYYFLDDSPARQHYLDLVMLTHGWRRFRTDNLYTKEEFVPQYFFEYGQFISGRVIGSMGRVAPEASVSAVAINQENVLGAAVTDSAGNFVITGLDFQDTTVFMVSAKTKRGKQVQRVDINPSYPVPPFSRLRPLLLQDDTLKTMQKYLTKKMYTTQDEVRVYTLDEVQVVTAPPRKPKGIPYGTIYDTTVLAPYKPLSLYKYIIFLPQVYRMNGNLHMRPVPPSKWGTIPLKITMNGQLCESDALYKYNIDDVEYIHWIRKMDNRTPTECDRGFHLDNYPCCVEFYLKPDRSAMPDFRSYLSIGYTASVEFYHPLYDTPEKFNNTKPDKRTTLYWNPYVETNSDGAASIEFYSDDEEHADYEITIEGVTPDGTVCRYQHNL